MRMRHAQRRRLILPVVLWVVFVLGGLLAGLFAWGNQPVSEDAPPWRARLHAVADVGAPWVGVIVAVAAVGGQRVRPRRYWKTVHDLLTSFRGTLFEKEAASLAAEHEHRITLFKRVWWRWAACKWPWSGWLLPVERSGTSTLNSKAVFRAPDDPTKATGIAGISFYLDNLLPVKELPTVRSEHASEAEVQSYAERTSTTVDYVQQRKPWARSYMGMRIVVRGRAWGVVVVDSVSERPKQGYKDKLLLGLLQQTLSVVLE